MLTSGRTRADVLTDLGTDVQPAWANSPTCFPCPTTLDQKKSCEEWNGTDAGAGLRSWIQRFPTTVKLSRSFIASDSLR
jgi:hypothetical protein